MKKVESVTCAETREFLLLLPSLGLSTLIRLCAFQDLNYRLAAGNIPLMRDVIPPSMAILVGETAVGQLKISRLAPAALEFRLSVRLSE